MLFVNIDFYINLTQRKFLFNNKLILNPINSTHQGYFTEKILENGLRFNIAAPDT